MAKKRRILLILSMVSMLCASGCSSPAGGPGAPVTLTMENSPSGPLTRSFNPFSTTSAANVLGATAMIYEPLMQFNILRPGTVYPWLAEAHTWSGDGKTLTLSLRPDVRWTDGQEFTGEDVAFTFDLLKKHPALNLFGIDVASATAPDKHTAVLTFGRVSYVDLYFIGSQPIVSRHIWSGVGDPAAYTDPNPVGTGPFALSTFSPQGFTLVRNEKYWQPGKPAIAALNFPAYDSNTSANLALANGSLDWAGNFVSNIDKTYVAKDPEHHKYFSPAVNVVSLFPNLTRAPLSDLAVRRAVSAALDRAQISKLGAEGTEPAATTSGGLVLPLYREYLDPALADDLAPQPGKVADILTKAGYRLSDGHWVGADGKPVAFTIEQPSSYTDYMTDAQVIADQLNRQGFQVKVSGVSVNAWTADVASGSFDATIHWSNSGPSPYYLYENWLDSKLSAPIGKPATGDYERFSDPRTDALLAQFAGSQDPQVQKSAILGLQQIVSAQLPVIPLMYGVAWGEYNTSKVTGWPTAENQYQQPQPASPYNEYTILQLVPRS